MQALEKIENQESKTIVNMNVHVDRYEEERSVSAYSRMLTGTRGRNAIIRKSPFCNYQNKDGISKNHQWMLNPGGNVSMDLKSLPWIAIPDDTASPMWYLRNTKSDSNEKTQNEEHTIKKGG